MPLRAPAYRTPSETLLSATVRPRESVSLECSFCRPGLGVNPNLPSSSWRARLRYRLQLRQARAFKVSNAEAHMPSRKRFVIQRKHGLRCRGKTLPTYSGKGVNP